MRSRMRLRGSLAAHRGARGGVRLALLGSLSCAVALICAGAASAAPPGSLDASFGTGGVVSLGGGSQLFGVAVQANGQPVAVGQSGGKVLVERFTTAGKPAGTYIGPVGYMRAVAIQTDGKIVVAGSSGGALLVERLTSSLTPDSSFGSGGRVSALAGQSAVANAVAIGSDGSIVAAGSVTPPNTQVGAVRLNTRGQVQWSKVLNLGQYSVAQGVAVQRDNKIVLVGRQTPGQTTNAVAARLNTDGSFDTSFHGGAITYFHANTGLTAFNAVTLQSDGKIIAGGTTITDEPQALFVRINTNGTLDSGFGAGGVTTVPAGQNVSVLSDPIGVYGIGIAAGGRIVGAGNYENTGVEVDTALWALTSRGAVDSSFGPGGTVRAPKGASEACALGVALNGSLVAVGDAVTTFPNTTPCSPNGASSGFLARYIGFGPIVPPPPPPPPALKVTLVGIKPSYKKSDVLKSGLSFGVGCNRACKIGSTLIASAAIAKRLHIGTTTKKCTKVHGKRRCRTIHHYKPITVATAQGRLGAAGVKTLVMKSARLSQTMRLSGIIKLTLNVAVTAPPSTKQTKLTRVLTFK